LAYKDYLKNKQKWLNDKGIQYSYFIRKDSNDLKRINNNIPYGNLPHNYNYRDYYGPELVETENKYFQYINKK